MSAFKGTIGAATDTVVIALQGEASCCISISGTYNGVNAAFNGSDDNGSNYYPLMAVRSDGGAAELVMGVLTNTKRLWRVNSIGLTNVQVAASAWVSGSAVINLTGSIAAFAAASKSL